jgi:hypothetical protein
MNGNPITEIRRKQGVNRKNFALASGMAYATLCNIEAGLCRKLQRKTLVQLGEMTGIDQAEIQKNYQDWRQSLKAA